MAGDAFRPNVASGTVTTFNFDLGVLVFAAVPGQPSPLVVQDRGRRSTAHVDPVDPSSARVRSSVLVVLLVNLWSCLCRCAYVWSGVTKCRFEGKEFGAENLLTRRSEKGERRAYRVKDMEQPLVCPDT
jgi:hypothetical protein